VFRDDYTVVPANVYDSLAGADTLWVDVQEINSAEVTGDGNATPWDGA
jgi:hypothetical protein